MNNQVTFGNLFGYGFKTTAILTYYNDCIYCHLLFDFS